MPTANLKIEKRYKDTAASRTFRNIRVYLDLGKKAVLDVGCSYGEFLVHFGPGSVGITLSPEEVSYAQAANLAAVKGNVEDEECLAAMTHRFDVVYANNIFEHLFSPHTFLTRIKDCLTDGGTLILGVPCVPKISWLMKFKKFRGSLATQHINFFTRDTLKLTVERAGWIVEDVRGFKFGLPIVDHCFDFVYPHFYVVARPDPAFQYSDKRKKELAGYKNVA